MKYVVSWTFRSLGSVAEQEAAVNRLLKVYSKWTPPKSVTYHQFLATMDASRWISCKPNFLLPVRVLSKLFRRLMLEKLLTAHEAGSLQFLGAHAHLVDAKAFAAFLAPLGKKRWFVYAKRPFAGPAQVLAYLARLSKGAEFSLKVGAEYSAVWRMVCGW